MESIEEHKPCPHHLFCSVARLWALPTVPDTNLWMLLDIFWVTHPHQADKPSEVSSISVPTTMIFLPKSPWACQPSSSWPPATAFCFLFYIWVLSFLLIFLACSFPKSLQSCSLLLQGSTCFRSPALTDNIPKSSRCFPGAQRICGCLCLGDQKKGALPWRPPQSLDYILEWICLALHRFHTTIL